MGRGRNYNDIINYDIELYKSIVRKYSSDDSVWEDIAWEEFYKSYIDPDGYSGAGVKTVDNIVLSSDALLSIKRIKAKEGFGEGFIKTFEEFRDTPIFYFPCEVGGINTSRACKLEDRIDHALLDLKHYLNGCKNCVLKNAYERPKTKKWLNRYNSFNDFIDDIGIKDIFVDKDYNVYDLDKQDKELLEKLEDKYIGPRNKQYNTRWSTQYYENIKNKICEFKEKRNR